MHEPHVGQGVSHTRPVGVGVQPVVLSLLIITSYQDQSPCLGSALVQNSTGSILAQSQSVVWLTTYQTAPLKIRHISRILIGPAPTLLGSHWSRGS